MCCALTLVLAAGAAAAGQQTYLIRGRVVAADGGAPIRGALVSMTALPGTITRTDESGRFEFASIDPAPAFVVTKTGFVLERVSGRSSSFDIRLQRGAALTVEAISRRGDPSAGATIHVQCGNSGSGAPADDRGIRRIAYLPPGRCEVSVEDPLEVPLAPRPGATPAERKAALAAMAERSEERRKRSVRITLRRGEEASLRIEGPLPMPPIARRNALPLPNPRPSGTAVIDGRIVGSDGRPIEGAAVVISPIPAPVMVTGTDGTFTFSDLPAGRYRIRAEKAGFIAREHGQEAQPDPPGEPIVVANGQHLRGIDIALPKGSVVSGRVRDTNGEPVADAVVALIPADGRRPGPRSSPSGPAIRTDDRGSYRVPGVAAGIYYVVAEPLTIPQPIGAARQLRISAAAPSVERAAVVDVPPEKELEGIDVTIDLH